jgi:hypothetical protein
MVKNNLLHLNSFKNKRNPIIGGFWNDLANLSLIPGIKKMNGVKNKKNKKISKIRIKGGRKKNKTRKQLGGFIRGGEPQHFYSACNNNINTPEQYQSLPKFINNNTQFDNDSGNYNMDSYGS